MFEIQSNMFVYARKGILFIFFQKLARLSKGGCIVLLLIISRLQEMYSKLLCPMFKMLNITL